MQEISQKSYKKVDFANQKTQISCFASSRTQKKHHPLLIVRSRWLIEIKAYSLHNKGRTKNYSFSLGMSRDMVN